MDRATNFNALLNIEDEDKGVVGLFHIIPEKVMEKIMESLTVSELMSIRKVCKRLNKVASYILETDRDVVFVTLDHLITFVSWIKSEAVFGQVVKFGKFELDINKLIRRVPGGSPHSASDVNRQFNAIKHAVDMFNQQWGTMVKCWDCNLQIQYQGVTCDEMCSVLLVHLLSYFTNLEFLKLRLPMIRLSQKEMYAYIPWALINSRNKLRTLVLSVRDYPGSPVASETYFEILRNTIFSLLKATTQLTTLKVTGGYRLPNNFIIPGLINNSNHLKTTLKTLVITLEITIKDLDALTAAKFERLQEVEILLIPDDNEKKSIDGFLQTCCSTLTSLTLRFKRAATTNELLQNEPKKNAMNTFPSRGIGCQFPCLHTLTIDGYIKGIVRMHVMPILQKLRLENSLNIVFISSDNHFISSGPSCNAYHIPLQHSLEVLELSNYVHSSSWKHPVFRLLTSKIKILRLKRTKFHHTLDVFSQICQLYPQLEELAIINCNDMLISDEILCNGKRPKIRDALIRELVQSTWKDNEDLRNTLRKMDSSGTNPGQISNLKRLKRLIIISNMHQDIPIAISDKCVYYGLIHCSQLEKVEFDFMSNLTWRGQLVMNFMLPKLNLSQIHFRLT